MSAGGAERFPSRLLPAILKSVEEDLQTEISLETFVPQEESLPVIPVEDVCGPFCITLSKLEIRKMVAGDFGSDDTLEGFLDLTFAGTNRRRSTMLGWAKKEGESFSVRYSGYPPLLYYGQGPELVSFASQMIESDRDAANLLKKIAGLLGGLSKLASWLPGPGMILGAGRRYGSLSAELSGFFRSG